MPRAYAAGGVAYAGLHQPADVETARQNVDTALEKKLFDSLGRTLTTVPEGHNVHKTLRRILEQKAEMFRSGEGFGWHEHDHDLYEGTERFFRPGYLANLVDAWLPALDGVTEKLQAGALVADIGCGHGASTILMAQAYPRSAFVGSDYHDASVQSARGAAERAGVADRVTFEIASAKEFTGGPYDLVCVFDALHDMGDPVGAARHVRSQLAHDGHVDDRRARERTRPGGEDASVVRSGVYRGGAWKNGCGR